MARGRKPMPTRRAKLHGNRKRKDELELKVPEGWPKKPDYFDDIASEEFDWICSTLDKMDMLTVADRPSIEQYCYSYSEFRKAVDHVKRYGVLLIDPKTNFPKVNPMMRVLRQHQDNCRKYLIEFGFTPSARARISMDFNKSQPTGDDFDTFLKVV